MKKLIYTIWNKEKQEIINCEHEDVYIKHSGEIGYIDAVGRFHEDDNLCINDIIIM